MPRNQTSTKTNAAGAVAARAAKPAKSRVTATKHSTAAATAAVLAKPSPEVEIEAEIIAASLTESPIETISKLAYGYWEERGRNGGDPLADWVRAEEEYRHSLAAL